MEYNAPWSLIADSIPAKQQTPKGKTPLELSKNASSQAGIPIGLLRQNDHKSNTIKETKASFSLKTKQKPSSSRQNYKQLSPLRHSSHLFLALQKRSKTFKSLHERAHALKRTPSLKNMQALQNAQASLNKLKAMQMSQNTGLKTGAIQGNAFVNNAPQGILASHGISHNIQGMRPYAPKSPISPQRVEASPQQNTSPIAHRASMKRMPQERAQTINAAYHTALPSSHAIPQNFRREMMSALNKYQKMGKTF